MILSVFPRFFGFVLVLFCPSCFHVDTLRLILCLFHFSRSKFGSTPRSAARSPAAAASSSTSSSRFAAPTNRFAAPSNSSSQAPSTSSSQTQSSSRPPSAPAAAPKASTSSSGDEVEPFKWDPDTGIEGVVKIYLTADQDNERVALTILQNVPADKRATVCFGSNVYACVGGWVGRSVWEEGEKRNGFCYIYLAEVCQKKHFILFSHSLKFCVWAD